MQRLTAADRWFSLIVPFLLCGCYFIWAELGWWVPAILALAALQFCTYGSTSHDLVHRNLGLPRGWNDFFLCLVELLAFRSGHAYQAAHLHHHARFPHTDDVEGAAAHMALPRALLEGIIAPFRVWWWAYRHAESGRGWLHGETAAILIMLAGGIWLYPMTDGFLIYAGFMIAGAWLNPLLTAYFPHDPGEKNPLFQTRRFRGIVASLIAWEHLYHLEHHLYPSIPHHHWPELAKRLDPYFDRAGVPAIRFWA